MAVRVVDANMLLYWHDWAQRNGRQVRQIQNRFEIQDPINDTWVFMFHLWETVADDVEQEDFA